MHSEYLTSNAEWLAFVSVWPEPGLLEYPQAVIKTAQPAASAPVTSGRGQFMLSPAGSCRLLYDTAGNKAVTPLRS
jgi:hypothetical protein